MERKVIYLRLRKKVKISVNSEITLGQIAEIKPSSSLAAKLKLMPIYFLTNKDMKYTVIHRLQLINYLTNLYHDITFEFIENDCTMIESVTTKTKRRRTKLLFYFVWIILFVGTAMTIINFHYDVSMLEVHQKINQLFKGEANHLLWIQIPYSFGLGIGMILFLNHWFHKRINEEPSPLQLELFKYEQSIYDYIKYTKTDLPDDEPSR